MACSGDSRLLSAICREFYRLSADFTSFFLFIASNHPESVNPGHVVQHGHHLPLSVDLLAPQTESLNADDIDEVSELPGAINAKSRPGCDCSGCGFLIPARIPSAHGPLHYQQINKDFRQY